MRSKLFLTLIILLFLFFLGNPFFVVNEYEQAIVTQFGRPVGEPLKKAGLYFKLPFVQKVNYFEKRILEWDGYPTQIPTKDKKYIWVDTTARWKINEPLKFFQSVYNERGAQARLDDIIDAAVRDLVTSHNLIEIVRNSNRLLEEAKIEKTDFVEASALERVSWGRGKLREEILKRAQEITPKYGIELVDVRIKRVNYVEEVRRKVYDRMISERKRAAERYRSEGRGKKAEIEGQTEKELKKILSSAYKTAQKIKGEADKEATKIYATAYSKDPEFFAFLKSLSAYSESIDEDTTLILTTDSEYLKYLKSSQPSP
ncbi:MAG: protease modulator HflC [Candidatus Omnitrophota bacterium]|nr:MAG: protease modulator HflC [Candidatus Omnitrophota bacterium]RKY42543.1 MAG: protease modulator HflC [Candidatus Omnitrophota bacterium]